MHAQTISTFYSTYHSNQAVSTKFFMFQIAVSFIFVVYNHSFIKSAFQLLTDSVVQTLEVICSVSLN